VSRATPAKIPLLALAVSLAGCRGMGVIEPSPLDPLEPGQGMTPGTGGSGPSGMLPPPGPGTLAPPTGGPQVMVGQVAIEPGRVVAHRLNRVEYDNTVRDLFYGTLDLRPASAFPVDNYAEGFDNNAEELRMSNLLLEKYLEAADKTVAALFASAPARARLVTCDPGRDAACPQAVLRTLVERAFRRPVTAEELDPYFRLVELARTNGDSAEVGLQLAVRAVLVAPSFLFRIEPDPPQGTTRKLSDHEIASRLSYFLWSSMPDDELFARSKAGALQNADEIGRQVGRMLGDARAGALVDNLAGQWLYTRQLPELTPDPERFPAEVWDEELRQAMRAETHLYLREVLLGDRPALDMLRSSFTFVNRRLAQHYGLAGAGGMSADMKLVNLGGADAGRRGGLLTQGAWLTVTSHPDTTSPVKRGKWILSELLCQEPPPPPPGVDNLAKGPQTGSMRERLAQHSAKQPCLTCHQLIDPMGFGLENYDAIGRWRDTDDGSAIDASGTVPGTDNRFNDAAELAAALQKDPRFARCMTRKLLTYALGRGMQESDNPALDLLTQKFVAGGHRFRALVETIAQSPLMTMRGGNSAP
jgi:hypothetical protein